MPERRTAVVSGAGPVGLALALQLARAGIDVTVLELRDTVNLTSKASTFHAATLNLLDTLGIIPQMLARGTRVDHVQYRAANGDILARLDFEALRGKTGFPFRLHYEQIHLCGLLEGLLADEPFADIRFLSGVTTVAEDADGVTVGYEHAGKTHEIRADYLFGCDGGLSGVRAACGIGFEEKPYPGMVVRLYTDLTLPEALPGIDGITYIYNGDDSVSLLKMHDCWRIIVRVPEGVSEGEALSDAWLRARMRDLLPVDDIMPRVTGRDTYAARLRLADAATHGRRVVLAGDAVHLTNTRGGMNLNAGLHDAFALARAAIAAKEQGSLEPLATAAHARERVARDILIPRTDQNVKTGRARLAEIIETTQDPARLADFLARQAMLDMLDGIAPAKITAAAQE